MAIKAEKPRIIPDADMKQLQAITSRLKKLRVEQKWGFDEFANHAGIHRTTLFKIEKNGLNLHLSTFLKVLRGLKITPVAFFQSLEDHPLE